MEFCINGQIIDIPETQVIVVGRTKNVIHKHAGCDISAIRGIDGKLTFYVKNNNSFDVYLGSGEEGNGKTTLKPKHWTICCLDVARIEAPIPLTSQPPSQIARPVPPASQSRSDRREDRQDRLLRAH